MVSAFECRRERGLQVSRKEHGEAVLDDLDLAPLLGHHVLCRVDLHPVLWQSLLDQVQESSAVVLRNDVSSFAIRPHFVFKSIF